jgi:nitrite reductase/ring-hydroxylating ferredoxin subunit
MDECAASFTRVRTSADHSEGTLKDGSVVCPWHGSEFALEDGHVLNGPATYNQPCVVVRERDGKIEVKAPA